MQISREQLAVAAFAEALLVIPKTLATNAAQDAISLLAKLRAFHNRSQTDKKFEDMKWFYYPIHDNVKFSRSGLDLEEGVVSQNREAGVFEPLVSKVKSLKFATEAAITILRIDDLIKLDKVDKKQHDDEDECM